MSDVGDLIARIDAGSKANSINIRSKDNKCIVNESLVLEVKHGDNIMILEDKFKSSYDCKTCKGSGKVIVGCLKCDGLGRFDPDTDCGKCEGSGIVTKECPSCHGKGALVIIPDSSKGRPTSGTIVSMGPDCSIYKLGDRVAYAGYIGNLLPFKQNDRIRVMRETEPFCQIIELEKDSMINFEFIDKDTAYDVS